MALGTVIVNMLSKFKDLNIIIPNQKFPFAFYDGKFFISTGNSIANERRNQRKKMQSSFAFAHQISAVNHQRNHSDELVVLALIRPLLLLLLMMFLVVVALLFVTTSAIDHLIEKLFPLIDEFSLRYYKRFHCPESQIIIITFRFIGVTQPKISKWPK